jgi:aromatic-L-amino-acid decarboxylase
MPSADEFRRIGHRVIDRLADYFDALGERPVFPDVDAAALSRLLDEPVPAEGVPPERVLAELEEKLFPYCTQTGAGGYTGLITASPLPMGVLGDLIASALNQNPGWRWSGASSAGSATSRATARTRVAT